MSTLILIMSLLSLVAATISFRRQRAFAPEGKFSMDYCGSELQQKKVAYEASEKLREYYVHRFENEQYQATILTNTCPIQGTDLDRFLCGLAGRELGFDEVVMPEDYLGKRYTVTVETPESTEKNSEPLPRAVSVTLAGGESDV